MNLPSLPISFLSPTDLSELDMKRLNFTIIFIFSTIFQIPFQNLHLIYHYFYLFLKYFFKTSFQSEAKYNISRFKKLKNNNFIDFFFL
jgi:hypothetical protein